MARTAGNNTVPTSIRLSPTLYEQLDKARGSQSLGEEMRRRLDASFAAEVRPATDDPRFRDLLTAIGHAAAGAARMPETFPSGIMEREGRQVSYDVEQIGPDTTAYEVFADVVHVLLRAFAPDGIVTVGRDTQVRLADKLIGLALGALGDRGLAAFARLSDVDREGLQLTEGDEP